MTSTEELKRYIDGAMHNRNARVAILVCESLKNDLDLIDNQPPCTLAAMIEYYKQMQLSGNAQKHRHKLRAALIEYLEERRCEAEEWESQLTRAIAN